MHLKTIILDSGKYPTHESYPFNLPIFQRTPFIKLSAPVTFFAGENGTGKSTLLQAMARKSRIHIWQDTERIHFEANPYKEALHRAISLEWTDGIVPGSFFSSDIFRYFSQYLDEWAAAGPKILDYFGGKSLQAQSHGQSLMSFFKARYRVKGLYLLDEPETALSPGSQIALLRLLRDTAEQGHAQFIIASHSPILLACPGAEILSFDHVPIRAIPYEETDHFRVYRDFMLDREKFLR
jgi:predicted ATPase